MYLSIAADHLAGIGDRAHLEDPGPWERSNSDLPDTATINTIPTAPDEPVEVAQEGPDWIYGQAWHLSIDIWEMETTTVATVASWAVIAVPQLWSTRTGQLVSTAH